MSADLWVPLRSPEDHGPRAYAAQLLEMLVSYGLITSARQAGEDGFVVVDGDRRALTPGQVLDEYGDRVVDMVTLVMGYSPITTTHTSVPVGAAGGPVPYIPDVGDRETEYARYWPSRKLKGHRLVPEETWCGGCYKAFTHTPIRRDGGTTPYCSNACAGTDRDAVVDKVKKASDKKRRK